MVHTRKQMKQQGSAKTLEDPRLHLSLAEPEAADSVSAGSWRVARDWSAAHSGKAPSGPQGVTAVETHTAPQSLGFFAMLLKETLDFDTFQIQTGFKLALSLTS